ncbi:hypothetical protein BDZ89DRAFT_758448 [Hymenopellis radicata]|nr:hypothetical protein BDZ89DRAFT_758448 [Hymenopellis radicata]
MPSATIRIPPRDSQSLYKSDAERKREEKLRADPHVTIISPQMVQCKRCDAQIKLSNVYAYEPSHWKTHRSRCLKKTPEHMKDSRRSRFGARHSQTPALSANVSSSSSSTPSLTSDDDDDEEKSHLVDDRPRSRSPPLPVPEPLLCPPVVNDYLNAMHGKSAYPTLDTSWRSWSWSHLQTPNFPAQ